jgi:hypothetical protein
MLGRWCILNREFNDRKIDLANIDHCGTCRVDFMEDKYAISAKKLSHADIPLKKKYN